MAAIFFDIDGTLWDKENHIPQSTRGCDPAASEKWTSDISMQRTNQNFY